MTPNYVWRRRMVHRQCRLTALLTFSLVQRVLIPPSHHALDSAEWAYLWGGYSHSFIKLNILRVNGEIDFALGADFHIRHISSITVQGDLFKAAKLAKAIKIQYYPVTNGGAP